MNQSDNLLRVEIDVAYSGGVLSTRLCFAPCRRREYVEFLNNSEQPVNLTGGSSSRERDCCESENVVLPVSALLFSGEVRGVARSGVFRFFPALRTDTERLSSPLWRPASRIRGRSGVKDPGGSVATVFPILHPGTTRVIDRTASLERILGSGIPTIRQLVTCTLPEGDSGQGKQCGLARTSPGSRLRFPNPFSPDGTVSKMQR